MTWKWAWVIALAAAGGRASADPACDAKVGKGQEVFVAGKPTGVIATNEPEKYQGSVITYPLDAKRILVAWASPGHYGRPEGSELFVADCKTGKLTSYAKGDFGHSRLLPDGKTLVFSDGEGRGIGLFDIATKKTRGLTYPPAFKGDVGDGCDGREPGLHDIIVDLDLDSDLLEFQRGGSCGFEGDWEATRYVIEHITTTPAKPRRSFPIAVVAAGAGNTVWAARAACDAGATAVAWSSTDLGATWTKHQVPRAASGIIEMFVDPKQAGHMSVVTGKCQGVGDGFVTFADRVHVTRDGGATWQLAKLPSATDETDSPAGDGNFAFVSSIDGSYDHLAVRVTGPDGETSYTSRDAGATWKRSAKPLDGLSAPKAVSVAGATLSPSEDGIIVRKPKAASTRVYPYRN